MSALKQLLIDLGKDADLMEKYVDEPRAVMAGYGCTEAEIEAMLEKDVESLKRLTGLDNLKANHTVKAYDYD